MDKEIKKRDIFTHFTPSEVKGSMINLIMKKILYLVTQSEFGGAQKYIADLASGLDESRYQVEIAVGEYKKEIQNGWLKQLENSGFKIRRLKHVFREVNPWHDFLSGFELFFLFLKTKPDIIHLNSSKVGSTGALIGWLYKMTRWPKTKFLKIIYTVHGFVFNEPLSVWRRIFYLWSERISGMFKNKIICVSERDKITGLNHKIANHKKFITIHNGIDLEKTDFLDKQNAKNFLLTKITDYGLSASSADRRIMNYDFIIGTIANFYTSKGLIYFIRAAKIVLQKIPNLIFIIIGEGALRNELEQEIKKLDLEKKFFLVGSLSNAFKYLKVFDIFCLPSVKEGFPYTLLEAMAAGLPIITTLVGGTPEIITDEVNGLIVPKEKPRQIARAIEKILNNPEMQKKLKKNNLEKIKQFSLEKMIESTVKVYDEK